MTVAQQLISPTKFTLCVSWCNALPRIWHHLFNILAKVSWPEFNHEETPENLNWEVFYKTNGLYSSKMSMLLKINKKLRNYSRLKETKEQWKSNSMSDPKLDFEVDGKKL